MIPPLNDHGYLPPPVHPATLDEIEKRFGFESEVRRAQMQSIRWLVDLAKKAGIERIVLNGSFVTEFTNRTMWTVLSWSDGISPEMRLPLKNWMTGCRSWISRYSSARTL